MQPALLPLLFYRCPMDTDVGLRAVIMKRYPKDWTVYVDGNGDGFVEAKNDNASGGAGGGTTKSFPSPEWIARSASTGEC